ncbi:hypothetical protein ABEY65_27590 [Priestia aryabhattai]|uniref:hypothetical protein n=1 Tax=Priestia aryabhattai TaxID=412384 RepID=UPI003D294468
MRIDPKQTDEQQCPNCDSLSFISQDAVIGVKEKDEDHPLGGNWGLSLFQCLECGYVMFFNDLIVNAEEYNKKVLEHVQQLKGEKG